VGRRSQASGDCVVIGLIRGVLQWMWWRWRRKWGPASPFATRLFAGLVGELSECGARGDQSGRRRAQRTLL
jgi:hypothetical protein